MESQMMDELSKRVARQCLLFIISCGRKPIVSDENSETVNFRQPLPLLSKAVQKEAAEKSNLHRYSFYQRTFGCLDIARVHKHTKT